MNDAQAIKPPAGWTLTSVDGGYALQYPSVGGGIFTVEDQSARIAIAAMFLRDMLATQAGALQAVGDDTLVAWGERNHIGADPRRLRWVYEDAISLAATQPNAAPAAEVVATDERFDAFFYGSFRDSGFSVGGHPVSSLNARHIWDAAIAAPAAAIDAREHEALPSHQEMAARMASARRGFMCPLCGRDYPHQHSPEEITIYRNGMKWGRNNGTEPWTGEVSKGVAQDAGVDSGPAGSAGWAGANEHLQHRTGPSDAQRASVERDSGGPGVSSQGEVREAAVTASRSESPAARPNAAGQEQEDPALIVDTVPPATSRDRWMYEQGRLAERDPRSPGTRAALIEECCALIKAADDKAMEGDYMLDSNDCISVLRGTWTPPLEAVGSSGMTPDHAQGDKT